MARSTLNLSEKGISIVYVKRRSQGLTYEGLASRAYVSVSTVKRFARGERISVDSFKHLCSVLGLEDWQCLVEGIDLDGARVSCQDPSPPQQDEVQVETAVGAIAVTGVFSKNAELQIEATLVLLQELLLESKVHISPYEEDLENEQNCYGGSFADSTVYDRRLAPMFRILEQQELEQRKAEGKIGVLAVTGVFSKNVQLQIEATLAMLRELLLDGKIHISMYDKNSGEQIGLL